MVDRRVIGRPKDVLRATGCKAGDRSVLTATDGLKVGRLLDRARWLADDRWGIGQPKERLRATGCKAGDRSVLAATDCVRVGRLGDGAGPWSHDGSRATERTIEGDRL